MKSKLTSSTEDSAHAIIKLESENKCLAARITELERELSNTYRQMIHTIRISIDYSIANLCLLFISYESHESKLRQGEELLNDNKGIITDIKNQNYELDNKIKEGFKSSHTIAPVRLSNMGPLKLNPI